MEKGGSIKLSVPSNFSLSASLICILQLLSFSVTIYVNQPQHYFQHPPFVVLGVELRTLCLLGKSFTTPATPPASNAIVKNYLKQFILYQQREISRTHVLDTSLGLI
jgi:hypothetical protein